MGLLARLQRAADERHAADACPPFEHVHFIDSAGQPLNASNVEDLVGWRGLVAAEGPRVSPFEARRLRGELPVKEVNA